MSIIVQNITKIYGQQKALNNVSFEIQNNEIVGFLGPNGAGKSTLMKIMVGYLPPTQGNITINGFDVINQSLEVRKTIGYLAENNPLYTNMYVKEFLAFAADTAGMNFNRKETIVEIIRKTGLENEQFKKIGSLSKGYRQRVGLAQALLHNPKVLILDEPTTGLDPNQIIEIRQLIKDIGREKTVILSTHLMQEVEAICQRVIIINKGEIIADDSAENLKTKAMQTKTLLAIEFDKEIEKEKIAQLQNISNIEENGKNKWIIEAANNADLRPALFKFAVENNLTILAMQQKGQSMEDVFHSLTS